MLNVVKENLLMNNYDFGGIKLMFDPQTRQLLDTVWLDDGLEYLIGIKIKHAQDHRNLKDSDKEYNN